MNDFDLELRQRLQRLEAAVPEPRQPTRSHVKLVRSRRRAMAVVAFAAAMTLVVGSYVAMGSAPPPDPAQEALDAANEARLSHDLAQHWHTCLSESDAGALVKDRLHGLGLDEWTIRLDRPSLAGAPCVGAAPIGDSHEVLLTPSMGERVNEAWEALKVDLLARCLDRAQAIELLRTTLESAGVREPSIAVGGMRGVPGPGPDSEESKAYVDHIADGCVVVGDAQSDQQGRYTWSLASR